MSEALPVLYIALLLGAACCLVLRTRKRSILGTHPVMPVMLDAILSIVAVLLAAVAWLLLMRGRSLDTEPLTRLVISTVVMAIAIAAVVHSRGVWSAMGVAAALSTALPLISAAWHVIERTDPPFEVTKVHLATDDGVRLVAYHHQGGKEDALIVTHSLAGSSHRGSMLRMVSRAVPLADPILLDLRGHGASGGVVDGREWKDVDAAIDYALGQGYHRVHLLGASIGAMASLRTVQEGARPASVTLISPPGTQERISQVLGLYRTLPIRIIARVQGAATASPATAHTDELRAGADMAPYLDGVRLTIVGCENDFLFNGDEARAVYDAASPPKRLVLLKGWRHGPLVVDAYPDDVSRELVNALRKAGAGG